MKANVARCIIELEKKNYLKTKYCNNKPLQCFKLEQHLVESLIDKTNKQTKISKIKSLDLPAHFSDSQEHQGIFSLCSFY